MNENQITSSVSAAIASLIDDFRKYPNKYLTEEDVRVHLCIRLMRDFGVIQETADGDHSIAMHTEVRWWGPKESRELSDIIIFDVSSLSVTPGEIRSQEKFRLIPRKGYSSNKPEAVIELKLRRNNGDSNNAYISQVRKDIEKLSNISTMFHAENRAPLFWVVALDKKTQIPTNELPKPPENINFQYACAPF